MRDAALRQQKDRLLQPLAARLFAQIHPNVISTVALIIGLLAAGAALYHLYWLGLGLWLLNRVLDGLDGVVARHYQKQSDFGGYLDLFFDFVVYLAVPVAFTLAMPTVPVLGALIALLASYYLNTMSWMGLAALLEKRQRTTQQRQTSLEMPTGLIEGAETIVLYATFFLFPGAVSWLFGLMALLVLFTAGQRLGWAYRYLR
jgi:phosphatidylglycerophosphate synthase